MKYSDMDTCNHLTIHTYSNYTNVYYCGMCGLRFNVKPKYDESLEGDKSVLKEHRHK